MNTDDAQAMLAEAGVDGHRNIICATRIGTSAVITSEAVVMGYIARILHQKDGRWMTWDITLPSSIAEAISDHSSLVAGLIGEANGQPQQVPIPPAR